MDSAPSKAFLLAQLLLLLSCFQEASCFLPPPPDAPYHHRPYPHPKPPVNPPPPPSPKGFVAVEGVVYCKSCEYTLNGAKPIYGAQVKLFCQKSGSPVVATATTDENGYFFLQASKTVTAFDTPKCKVYLLSSPFSSCREPSNLNGGLTGASLRYEKLFLSFENPFILYSVGPLAFQPKCKGPPAK